MTGAEYIVETLIANHATDAFGIPGGVLLKLLYAMEAKRPVFTPHLCYHEQAAGFAANGYAQACGRLGVAYATRGPGVTNMITPIADAYYDSIPVLYITAHSDNIPQKKMRITSDQEMDMCTLVNNITKKATRIDNISELPRTLLELCHIALEGRKGPVFMDVSSKILSQDITEENIEQIKIKRCALQKETIIKVVELIRNAKRPVILAGDGIIQSRAKKLFNEFIQSAKLPVISSRFSHEVMDDSSFYFGYVGSHGIRSANFILSKADLILSLGNRLHFPVESTSYKEVYEQAKIIRCDIDANEFARKIPNSLTIRSDVYSLLLSLVKQNDYGEHSDWMNVCTILKQRLQKTDLNCAVIDISKVLNKLPLCSVIVNDVGNNEFWVSRAIVLNGFKGKTLYSKSLGALGCGIPKAIGAYYATNQLICCFVGDQGFQMNIQELQYIVSHSLPILIVVLNNATSGMIKDKEDKMGERPLHTTKDSGYYPIDLKKISIAYGLDYANGFDGVHTIYPRIIEMQINPDLELAPQLPKGNACQDMMPSLERNLFNYLNEL